MNSHPGCLDSKRTFIINAARLSRGECPDLYVAAAQPQPLGGVQRGIMRLQRCLDFLVVLLGVWAAGCGTCSLQLRVVNDSPIDQSVDIASNGKLIQHLLLNPKADTTATVEHFKGTSLRFPNVHPDSIYYTSDVDHWFGMVHKDTVVIRPTSIDFGSWYLYRRQPFR